MGLFDTISKNLANSALSAGASIAEAQIKRHLPAELGGLVGIGGKLINGDINGAAESLVGSGILRSRLPFASGIVDQILYMNSESPLMGGITPDKAREIHDRYSNTKFARKNLFLLEISEKRPAKDGSNKNLRVGGILNTFNLFVTEISYSPFTITGEKRKIGSTSTDSVHSSEPAEIRITTMDDSAGTIKKWFAGKCSQAAPSDGTVGLPIEYLVEIRVLHSFITDELGKRGGAFSNVMLMRPANIDIDLSRRDQALEELVLTFVQFDNYFPVAG